MNRVLVRIHDVGYGDHGNRKWITFMVRSTDPWISSYQDRSPHSILQVLVIDGMCLIDRTHVDFNNA